MVVSAQPVAPSCGNEEAIGALRTEEVHLERPGTGSNNTFVLEIIHLDIGIVPVAVDQSALGSEQGHNSIELFLIQIIGIFNAQFRVVNFKYKAASAM